MALFDDVVTLFDDLDADFDDEAAGGFVIFSEPWRLGYYRPVANSISFERPPSLVVPTQGGCYIVADKTRWFAGDLGNPTAIVDVLPYGGVPGTMFKAVSDESVGWFSDAGVVIADASGQAVAVMADPIDLTAPAAGCSNVITSNGFERVISCGWAVNLTTRAATQYGNFAYTSFAADYGTKADGIYQVVGATDHGTAIAAIADLGRQHGGTLAKKRLRTLRLGATSEDAMTALLATPEYHGGYSYDSRRVSGSLEVQQVKPGRGLVAAWFGIAVANQNGADFTLAEIVADFIPLPWRI
jgi:hypothetical protein